MLACAEPANSINTTETMATPATRQLRNMKQPSVDGTGLKPAGRSPSPTIHDKTKKDFHYAKVFQ
jgi:hypothetical protein